MRLHDRARNKRRRVLTENRKPRILGEAAIQLKRIGIDQQLGGIEPQPALGRPFTFRAVAVMCSGKVAGQFRHPILFHALHGDAPLLTVLEQAEPKRSGLRRTNRKSRRLPGNAGAELRAHASSDR